MEENNKMSEHNKVSNDHHELQQGQAESRKPGQDHGFDPA